jgi:hypothetical protein
MRNFANAPKKLKKISDNNFETRAESVEMKVGGRILLGDNTVSGAVMLCSVTFQFAGI